MEDFFMYVRCPLYCELERRTVWTKKRKARSYIIL